MTTIARRIAPLVAVLLGIAVTAVPAAAKQIGPRVEVDGKSLPEADPDTISTSDDPANGMTAPGLTGESFSGKPVTFENNGKARILIFLSHSCPHCQAEVPELVKLAKKGKLDDVEIDTITTNTSKDLPNYPPSKWLKREKWPFKPILADDKKLRAFFAYGGTSFPYFVFVAADGTVAARASGELPRSAIAAAAQRLAAGESLYEESA
jgi:cytochrome c biogenesis protein CcmG, thiol:disulfide interchange protein DsbE